MPVLPDPAPGKAHQPHEPSKSDREDKQCVLRTLWHLSPADFSPRFSTTHHEHIDQNDADDCRNHCKHLIDTESDPHDRRDEVPVHPVEKDYSSSNNEKGSLDCGTPFFPGHDRLLVGPTVEQE